MVAATCGGRPMVAAARLIRRPRPLDVPRLAFPPGTSGILPCNRIPPGGVPLSMKPTTDTFYLAPGAGAAAVGMAAPSPAGPNRGTARLGWTLTALLGAMFLGNVDVAIANIATPSIHASLHASGADLELVVSGYTLAYAMLLVVSARLGQARGYRRVFLAGLGAFTVASLACGLAPSPLFLVVARVAAGAGAALMAAQVLTGIQLSFSGRARARALGLYALVLSAGAVAGQSLGGLLISANLFGTTWRPTFLVNVPLGVTLIFVAWRALPAAPRSLPERFDLTGAAILSGAVLLVVLPLVVGRDAGWPAWTWACLAASVPAFAAFVIFERRLAAGGGQPLVSVRLLTRPAIGWGLISQAANTATYFAMLFTLALYLQQGLGRSAAYSGLALVSWVAAFGVPGPLLGRLPAGLRRFAAPAGSLILAAGFAALAAGLLDGDTSGPLLMTLLGVAGFGLGSSFTAMLSHLTGSVTERHAPDISGLFNTVTRVGGVIGVATFGTAYFSLVPHPAPSAAVHGFAIVNLALAATAAAAAVAASLSIRRR
jgi:MFS family permease